MSEVASFGHPSRYYASGKSHQQKDAGLFDAPRANADVLQVLKHHQILKDIVQRTVTRWNDQIRILIKDETGLKFTGRNEGQALRIEVVDGLPLPLASVFEEDSDPIVWELILNNATLKTTQIGLKVVEENFDSLLDWRKAHNSAITNNELQNTKALVDGLITWLDSLSLKERIKKIDEDVLGAYFFHKRNIQIYWMAISIVAGMLDVSVERLTVAVFAHELTHAYTHLGNDHDGEQWPTNAFADADNHIVEGLAQFYTAQVCKKFESRLPGVLNAFEQLLSIQSPAYTCFRNWGDENERAGEIVRFSMIGCRKRRLTKYPAFLAEIGKVRERIGRSTPQHPTT